VRPVTADTGMDIGSTSARGTSRVAIVGAGSVGATIAYACLIRGVAGTVALYDLNADKTTAEVLDLEQGIQFVPMAQVVGSDDVAVTAGSDIVVVTAGAKQKPGQTRLELAGVNVEMCRKLIPQLVELSPDAIILMVTNPVDVLTYAAQKFAGLPSNRVFGSGTVLDSSRLRILLARHAGVAVQSVHAYVVGEHGDSELPLWSTATIGPIPVGDWSVPGVPPLDTEVRDAIAHEVVTAAERIIRGKGATNYAIGLSTARIVEAVLKDEKRILPVSSLLDGPYGLSDVCLSLPTVVDRRGIVSVLTPPVDDEEQASLNRSAEAVRSVARSLGL
jgi:L-lactate dehydrogenase